MKKLICLTVILLSALVFGQNLPNISTGTKGQLPTERLSTQGVAGLCLESDGIGGVVLQACSGGSGSGTVTSFSAGTLSPLFTTSVTNSSTTPSLAFILTNASAHTFFGNNSGSVGSPLFFQAKTTDLTDFSPTAPTASGKVPIFDQPSGTYIPGDPLVQGVQADGSITAVNPVAIGGYDTAGTPALHRSIFINGNPAGTEYGIVTRNIPSGTQAVSGSVSISGNPAVNLAQIGGTNQSSANVVDSGNGAFKVNCIVGCSSTPGFTDNSGFTAGTTTIANLGGVFNDGLSAVTSGNAAGTRITTNRALHINLRNNAGTEIGTSSTPIQVSLANTATNATAVKVDGSGVTQPVSGTVSTTPPSNASTNVTQVGSTAIDTNSGVKSAGTQRVVIATDQPQLTNALKVDGSGVTQPISAAALPLPTGAAQDATLTGGTAKVRVTGNAGAVMDVIGQNGSSPANSLLTGCQFNTSPTTVTSGNSSPVQCDNSGNTLVKLNTAIPAGANVIGHTINDTGSTTAVTGNVTVVQPTGTNLHVDVDTALPAGSNVIGHVINDTGSTTAVTGTVTVAGAKTNNNAAPGATNTGVLPALANASNPSWTEGNQVLESVDLSGNIRTLINSWFGSTAPTVGSKTSASSIPVVIASDQGAVTVSQATAANLNATVAGTLSDNGAAASTNRIGMLPGVFQTTPGNGTAATQGRNASLSVGTDGMLWVSSLPARRPASYSASKKFAASSTTDNFVIPGNATTDILVTKLRLTCIQTTAGALNVEVIKRSAADTSGTSASITAVPDDSGSSAASSTPLSYTGTGPSVGTAVGDVDNVQIGCNAAATVGPNDIYILNRTQKPIVLIGTAQQLAINLGGAVTGGNITVSVEWIEVTHIAP